MVTKPLQNVPTKHGLLKVDSMDRFLNDLGLEEIFKAHRGIDLDTSTSTWDRFIDRVAVWNVPLMHVARLPFNIPARSDHLAFAIDINVDSFFGSV